MTVLFYWCERFAYNAFEEGLGWNLFPPYVTHILELFENTNLS